MIIREDMTIEEIMIDLADEYENFNWQLIRLSEATGYFVNELKKETGNLNNIERIYAVAKCESNDDVLFLMCDEKQGTLWRIYHLTYSSHSKGYPKYEEFKSRKDVCDYIQNKFIEEFL